MIKPKKKPAAQAREKKAKAEKLRVPAAKKAPAKKSAVRRKNPLQKWVAYAGPQFPDSEKGKQECIEFAQRFATKHGMVMHVYKA